MKVTRHLMGMHITVEILGGVKISLIEKIFDYFVYVDEKFSIYKKESEISLINAGRIKSKDMSSDMKKVLLLCQKTKKETGGYFDISQNGKLDPSGLVKGWAIYNAGKIAKEGGAANFYIDAGGDVQTYGLNKSGKKWRVGIKSPFNELEIVKTLGVSGEGVATSGLYERGEHIYNPKGQLEKTVKSLTVIGPNVYEADRFATAAFAMGTKGIEFLERLPGFEGYMVTAAKKGISTSGFERYADA